MSAPCRDLLSRLLVANPNERMCMEEIKEHSWFLEDLPDGALAMNDWYLQSRPVYDQARCLPAHAYTTRARCLSLCAVESLWAAEMLPCFCLCDVPRAACCAMSRHSAQLCCQRT